MIVPLIVALVVAAFLFYVFCYSPPAQRFANEIFYDPLQESIMREIAKEERRNEIQKKDLELI